MTLEKIKDNLYKINKHQYLKVTKKGNGEVIAPARDPVTKQLNWHNICFTGGTVWGLMKVIFIVLFLLFLLWRYNIETNDCIELRKYIDPYTGCIDKAYFNIEEEVYNEQINPSLYSFTKGNDRPLG